MGTLFIGDGQVRFGRMENSYMQKSLEPNDNQSFKSVYKYEATCPKECTAGLSGSIWLTVLFLHMHTYGRQI